MNWVSPADTAPPDGAKVQLLMQAAQPYEAPGTFIRADDCYYRINPPARIVNKIAGWRFVEEGNAQ